MTVYPLRIALAVSSLAAAVTVHEHWVAVLFAFLSGLFAAVAVFVTIIERQADHEPY